jgi:hypothetical protein
MGIQGVPNDIGCAIILLPLHYVSPKGDTLRHRRSIRLKNYDYRQNGAYFATICSAVNNPAKWAEDSLYVE